MLTETLDLDLPNDVRDLVEFVIQEFETYSNFMQVTIGEPEKQAVFTKHMASQIKKAMDVVEATKDSYEWMPVSKYGNTIM